MAESNRKGSFWLFEAGQRSLDATWELYQNNTQYGWAAGGGIPAATSLVDRIDFSNDIVNASPRGGLTTARWYMGAAGNANYGWFGGGQTPTPAAVSNVERIQYSNDSPGAASARGTFPAANSQMGAASNNYYGWFAGGLLPAAVSTVNRIDFANDSPTSSSIRGPLAAAEGLLSGLGNQYYGWFGSGQAAAPAQVSFVQRIDYANDSPTSATQRGPLSQSRSGTGAVANLNYGWWGGGYVFPATYSSTVDRIDFANDSPTAAVPRGPLTAVKAGTGASGNQNYGWFTGALLPAVISNVDRIDYSNDTVSVSVRGFLNTAKGGHGATAGIAAYPQTPSSISTTTGVLVLGNGSFGWFAGGSGTISTIDRMDFANDLATASVRGSMTGAKGNLSGTNNANYGWFAGGYISGPLSFVSIINRIDFSNDSPATASLRGPLSSARSGLISAGNANYGWFTGGSTQTPSIVSTVDRVDYSNDSPTIASLRGPLSSARYGSGATSNANYAWIGGGNIGAGIRISTVDRIDFSNDSPTVANTRGNLTAARNTISATGNANYGWFIGGAPGPISTVDRIDYSNDSPTSASPRGNLDATKTGGGATGNTNYGWYGGGSTPTTISTVSRIDYSNDTALTSVRGILSSARVNMTGISNYVKGAAINVTQYAYGSSTVGTRGAANYGWFGGGLTPTPANTSSVDRLDFSNDTATTSPRGPLSAARSGAAAAGNASYGWFGSGATTPSVITSGVDRIDFANDSPTSASPRGTLSVGRQYISATGNANYGWWGGGITVVAPSTYTSKVDRIDFANESPTSASPRGPLSLAKGAISASSNGNYGWFNGGVPGQLSSVDRIDFANDSPTAASPRGTLTQGRWNTASAGNTNYGWIGGGALNPAVSIVERIDYSSDTATASIRNSLSGSRYQLSAAGNASYGWFGGGYGISFIDRIDFANDTNANALRRSSLSNSMRAPAATSNYVK
jgi:hypothetical protein